MGNSASEVQATIREAPVIEPMSPELLASSTILSDKQMSDLYRRMPCRLQSQPWKLTFSTEQNGYSLMTMYRLMETIQGPVLVVIKDFQGTIFGVLTSDPLLIQSRWYGRCESFLYTYKSDLSVYGPTFLNDNCIFAAPNYLMFGGGKDGLCGLFISEEFCDGSSFMCETYRNKQLSKNEHFLIRAVEMWTFYDKY